MVEHQLPKLAFAGSIPVSRSKKAPLWCFLYYVTGIEWGAVSGAKRVLAEDASACT